MSNHYFLFSEQTGECVEAVAVVGSRAAPRIEANALQAFLVYHHINAPGADLFIRNIDSLADGGRSIVRSLEEAAEIVDQMVGVEGFEPPILIWTKNNYRALAERDCGLRVMLQEYEAAPSGGIWVRRTADGRLIS